MMFGYACTDTPELMPLPIMLAHRLARRLAAVRKDGVIPYLRPDGKTQVTIGYEDDRPVRLDTVVISTQHAPDINLGQLLTPDIARYVLEPELKQLSLDASGYRLLVNPTGRFEIGGPMGDTGLTGRKIIMDTAGLARRCEVQVAYAIGKARPVGLFVDCFGTETVPVSRVQHAIEQTFDLRPAAIIDDLKLLQTAYSPTASYGHFGRDDFTWEQTDRVDALMANAQT